MAKNVRKGKGRGRGNLLSESGRQKRAIRGYKKDKDWRKNLHKDFCESESG